MGHDLAHVVDLAVFYERNNLLLDPDFGFVPGNVFATITEGLDRIAAASQDLWKRGVEGEGCRSGGSNAPPDGLCMRGDLV